MVAGKYVDPSTSTHPNKEKCYQIWWGKRECTWEPATNVLNDG